MPIVGLVILFLLVPFVELYLIYKVQEGIGLSWTLLLLVADSVLGAVLLRSQGRAVWRRFNEALQMGRMPHREVQDGVLVIFGGALLMTPGFLSDVVGILLLVPPTRSVIRAVGMRVVRRRMEVRLAGAAGAAGAERPRASGFDVEGTATEYEEPPRELRR